MKMWCFALPGIWHESHCAGSHAIAAEQLSSLMVIVCTQAAACMRCDYIKASGCAAKRASRHCYLPLLAGSLLNVSQVQACR